MKKGFTLIELLAVIVILAIIALIATPIILGIINDARKESNERSAELYASAVRNAIAAYQLTGTSAPTKFSDLDIQYDGNVVCATEELYEDGSFYIADCTVNGDEVEYTYGEQQVTQVYKPQYYAYTEFSGNVGETAAPANPSTLPPTEEIRYLGYDVTDGKVSAAYSCFVRNETEYCLKSDDYAKSIEIIKDAYADVVDTEACSFGDDDSDCRADGLSVGAYSSGTVSADGGGVYCYVYGGGYFACRG
jgi:prepilin-type N-terminal cleavage/methylation domain-containing protein